MKKVMIFGAGINQISLIKAVNNLGYESIVIDPNENSPGKEFSNYFYCIKSDDYESTKRIAKKHNVDSIVTSQMQNPLRLMAKLANDIKLNFMTPDIMERTIDKFLMKQCFLQNRVPCAKGFLFNSTNDFRNKNINELQFPLIIKPIDSHSSKGVYKIDKYDELQKYIDITSMYSSNGKFVIEEFLEGPEYSIESVTFNHKTSIIQFTEKIITNYPNTVELGHVQPANLTYQQKKNIEFVVNKAISSLGINNSVSHTEIKITKNGPYIIEIGARGGGDFISSYLTYASTGIDLDEAAVQISLGIKPKIEPKISKYSFIKYFELPVGKKVNTISDYKNLLKDPEILLIHFSIKEGDIVQKITDSSKRPGFFIIVSDSRESLLIKSQKTEKQILGKINLI